MFWSDILAFFSADEIALVKAEFCSAKDLSICCCLLEIDRIDDSIESNRDSIDANREFDVSLFREKSFLSSETADLNFSE